MKQAAVPSNLTLELLTVLEGRSLYGLEIQEYINTARNQLGIKPLRIGSLYPALASLHKKSLIQGTKGSTNKVYYCLTDEGEELLKRVTNYRTALSSW